MSTCPITASFKVKLNITQNTIQTKLCVFEPPYGGLGTTYDVHLGLIGKRVVDFI